MKKIQFLDLREIMNHRMVYPDTVKQEGDIEIGESNNYIDDKTFFFDQVITEKNVRCVFQRNNKKYDNVICSGQVLDVKESYIKKIIIVGFCCWGWFKEDFYLECLDGTVEKAKAYFSDAGWLLAESGDCCYSVENKLYTDCCKILCNIKLKTGGGYIYYYITEFKEVKAVKKIIFPDNCLMHIFAITIEN